MGKKDVWNVPPVMPDKLKKRLNTPVAPLKKQKKTLTAREWAFVKEYVSGDGEVTMKEAAIRAGFSPKSASSIATRLTSPDKAPHVVAAIQEYRAELAEKYGTNFDRHMRDLQKIRDAALQAGAYGAAVTAEYRRGQALGTIYVDRKEIRVGTIDSMSKEEVQAKLDEMKKLYGGPPPSQIIDITPEEVKEDASDAGEPSIQTIAGELTGQPDHEDRKPRESRNSGLPDSTERDVCDGGTEGGEERTEGPP